MKTLERQRLHSNAERWNDKNYDLTVVFLVPTRCVGMQFQRAALSSRPQRGQYEFPRSAWELGNTLFGIINGTKRLPTARYR